MNKQLVESVLSSLQPTFAEFMDREYYYNRYQAELAMIQLMDVEDGSLTNYLNYEMDGQYSSTPEHHACTDVASTLAELDSHFGSLLKFK